MAQKRATYNGFAFPFSKVEVSESTQMSDDGLSPLGTLYKFTFTGALCGESPAGLRAKLLEMRAKLTQPRRSLEVAFSPDGVTWSQDWTFDAGGDDAWGPIPGELWARSFAGGSSCLYNWSVQAFKKQGWSEASEPADPQSNILAISREWSHSIDEAGYTTRTVSGVLKMKRTQDEAADLYRDLLEPVVPPWFQRVSRQYTQSASGLELHYTIVDVERHWTLPKPVIKGHATYSARLAPQNGMMVTHSLSGEFQGAASTTKAQLVEALNNLLLAKFPDYSGATSGPQLLFTEIGVSENIYENSIAFNITGEVAGGGASDFSAALLRFYQVPPDSTGEAAATNPYGNSGEGQSSGVIAPVPGPWDAAGTMTGPADPGLPELTPPTTQPGETPRDPGTATPPAAATSAEHQQRPYLEYREVLAFEVQSNVVVYQPMSDAESAAPFAQRTAMPSLTILQSGYWIRATKDATSFPPPKPYGYNQVNADGTPTFIVLAASLQPQNAEPMGTSGWFTVTLHWRYTLRANYRLDDTLNNVLYFPADPRHASPVQPELDAGEATNAADRWRPVERLDHSALGS